MPYLDFLCLRIGSCAKWKKNCFVVPTTIALRYNPNKDNLNSSTGTTSAYVQISSYTIEFRSRIDKVGISRVSSMSHPIQIHNDQENAYLITFAQPNTHLDRDILVDLELIENHSNAIVAVESGAVMVSFLPIKEDCQLSMNNVGTTNEFILSSTATDR
ncbi:unnamed protein product [Rotaria sp. Silwood2]|nr:unnamed protein product [Rotaria sp. Silwood2]